MLIVEAGERGRPAHFPHPSPVETPAHAVTFAEAKADSNSTGDR